MSKRLQSPHIWMPDNVVEANARLVLAGMARDYFAAGRKVVAAKSKPAELHPFRLSTKRFRYTLETFRDVYGPSMETRLQLLKPLQDALGAVNDCVATRDEFKAGKKFDRFLADRGRKKTKEFFAAWEQTFDAAGEETSWVRYLARVRPAPASRKTKPAIDT